MSLSTSTSTPVSSITEMMLQSGPWSSGYGLVAASLRAHSNILTDQIQRINIFNSLSGHTLSGPRPLITSLQDVELCRDFSSRRRYLMKAIRLRKGSPSKNLEPKDIPWPPLSSMLLRIQHDVLAHPPPRYIP